MARESLADRVKSGPLTPRWKQVVAKNKGIDDLKGDIDGPVGDYDKNLKAATDANDDLHKAGLAMIAAFTSSLSAAGKAVGEHQKAFDKLAKEEHARWAKTSADANKIINSDIPAALTTLPVPTCCVS